jgi:hypothetical protein
MTKSLGAQITAQVHGLVQSRQARLKDQLEAVAAFPKELRRALPVYIALCKMSNAIPCTMGEGSYIVLDDIGEQGHKEFDAAQDAIDSMIVAVVVYVERLWSVSFGFRGGAKKDANSNEGNDFWDACPEFYGLSCVDSGWQQYNDAWENRFSYEMTARKGKRLVDNWKRERVKAQRVVDRYTQWWNSFWKEHPELAAEYEDKKS